MAKLRHALLIGSETLGLRGPHNDVAVMSALLQARGFEITPCIGAGATRNGILTAYQALIARAQPDDVVVIYYAGHGAYAEDGTGRRVQYILPTDWSDDDDVFHGIIDSELSDLLAQLTTRTPNVTVILDCCHSALVSRGVSPPTALIARAVAGRWTPGLRKHLETAPPRVHITGNPFAVRLAAAEADREAFEGDLDVDGKSVRNGLFTRALQQVLDEPGSAALSWRSVCNRVREQVLVANRWQRPSVEGPADRTVFTTSEQSRPDAVAYFEDRGKPALRVSALLGARVNSEYDVVRRGETAVTAASRVATATITAFDGSTALVSLSDEREPPQVGALAFPRISPFPAIRTVLAGRDNPALRDKLSASPFISLVDQQPARFVVETSGDELVVVDHADGVPTSLRLRDDVGGRSHATQWIERWAKAESLRGLAAGGLPDSAIELTWGCAVAGKLDRRAPGEPFRVGEKICLYVKNAWHLELYVWVFDIGVFGKVTLISGLGEGQKLASGGQLAIGDDRGVPVGLELAWPADRVGEVGSRRESLVVLAADHWVDVGVFETPTLVRRGRGPSGSPLESLLRSLGAGVKRDLGMPASGQVHGVRRIDFDLQPRVKDVA